MKRFLLFAGSLYYPAGGWDDFVGSFDTAEEAHAAAEEKDEDWSQIIDTETGLEVEK